MDLEGLEGLDGFTLAARIEAKRLTVTSPVTPLQRRLPATFRRPTPPRASLAKRSPSSDAPREEPAGPRSPR